jgi:hypothetical protein
MIQYTSTYVRYLKEVPTHAREENPKAGKRERRSSYHVYTGIRGSRCLSLPYLLPTRPLATPRIQSTMQQEATEGSALTARWLSGQGECYVL